MSDELETKYADQLQSLRNELTPKILPEDEVADSDALNRFLESNELDDKLAQYVVLMEATPKGLAKFSQKGTTEAALIEQLLSDTDLLKQMLVADGAKAQKKGPAQYGPAMKIYTDILKESPEANEGFLGRLAVAMSLEHAVPIKQDNPKETDGDPPEFIDPLKRYFHYKKAYEDGELDPAFDSLTVFDYRKVVNGDEPDETLAWGRSMLRNFRPDQILRKDYNWRYSGLVQTDVRYGSQNVKYDRPELQLYQNILMNGGVCGRRAFIGRFILRAFGIPTEKRPSPGHGALCHWNPKRWVVNLGGGWGCGTTPGTPYNKDLDFLATTQARRDPAAYMKVKRAQWVGDVLGEHRVYGEHEKHKNRGFWYGASLSTQQAIIDELSNKDIKPPHKLSEHPATIAERVLASPAQPKADKITYNDDGVIAIPAASQKNKKGKEIAAMTSFLGGSQIYLSGFSPQGKTMLRGGTFKCNADHCCSGKRLLSGGMGKYHDWGFRVAVSLADEDEDVGVCNSEILTLDLGGKDGVTMELVFISPGTFVMGGESETDGRFECVEVPKHGVELSHGYYLGKYPVTQAQYKAMIGNNPSKSTRAPNCPVDNVGVEDALEFCTKLSEKTGHDVRLPTEAEWEYACRAGQGDTKWFFGDDPAELGEYAWFQDNSDGKSHPVGEKKPNPWGLYDMYGNVWERISDTYVKNYYANSPPVDPTGPKQGTKCNFEYKVNVSQSGSYSLMAKVVTVNYNQRLNVSVKWKKRGETSEPVLIEMPFTLGDWKCSDPVTIDLEEGENILKFWRDMPPQYGLVVKEFTLTPIPC